MFEHQRSNTGTLQLETLSLQPLLFGVDSFLADEECNHMIDLASKDKNMLKESPVVKMDHDIGKETKQWRTSSQMWLHDKSSPILAKLTSRVSDFTGTGKSHQEAVQMLRYYRDQFYSAHLDAFDPKYYHSNRFDSSWSQKSIGDSFLVRGSCHSNYKNITPHTARKSLENHHSKIIITRMHTHL